MKTLETALFATALLASSVAMSRDFNKECNHIAYRFDSMVIWANGSRMIVPADHANSLSLEYTCPDGSYHLVAIPDKRYTDDTAWMLLVNSGYPNVMSVDCKKGKCKNHYTIDSYSIVKPVAIDAEIKDWNHNLFK